MSSSLAARRARAATSERYRWVVLSNTTLGTFLAMFNTSVVIISLPTIFRGIHVKPLDPANFGLLLWTLQGYLLVTAVLVVTVGRIGDIVGRVKMYNAGFMVFALASIALAATPADGTAGAVFIIVLRVVQGIGGSLIMANSAAILTDAFDASRRGMAMGFNVIAGIGGSFLGLIAGGVVSAMGWRLVFFVSVPIGVIGAIWSILALHETADRQPATIDWWGNLTFGLGLTAILVGLTYGIQPAGGHPMGWQSPLVLGSLAVGAVLLVAFVLVERRARDPLIELSLFRLPAFAAGGISILFANIGRGGLQFMLIVWLQGIWLPLHGVNFVDTPFWAAIYLIPLSVGFITAGPIAGHLSDRYGQRAFTTGGMALTAATFAGLCLLPVDFGYPAFAVLLLLNGIGTGAFSAPNTSLMMGVAPPAQRGAASGIRATFMNTGYVVSIGLFFSLMVVGMAGQLPQAVRSGLLSEGVPSAVAARVAAEPPVAMLFAAFLGYNPLGTLLGPDLSQLTAAQRAAVTSPEFLPHLISGAFQHGLLLALGASGSLCALAAVAAWRAGSAPR